MASLRVEEPNKLTPGKLSPIPEPDLRSLRNYVIASVVLFVAALGLALFGSAGTFDYWEAWVYLLIIALPSVAVTRYLYLRDPKLLERRRRFPAGMQEHWPAMVLMVVALVLVYVIPGLDHRFGWSNVPIAAVLAADVVVLAGYLLQALVFKTNSYAAAAIVVEERQRVISTGPYAFIRHPMYLGAILNLRFYPPGPRFMVWAAAGGGGTRSPGPAHWSRGEIPAAKPGRLLRLHPENQIPAAAGDMVNTTNTTNSQITKYLNIGHW